MYPEAKNTGAYLRSGWHVAIAYVIGFFIMLGVHGWEPGTQTASALPDIAPRATEVAAAYRSSP
jgi:hypothetical protein